MTGLWSLESWTQLFTQKLYTQHIQPERAHGDNKVGSGTGVCASCAAPVCVCMGVCSVWMYVAFCMGCLHWPNQADLLVVQSVILLCSCVDCLVYLFWLIAKSDALISVMNHNDSVRVCFPSVSWPQAQSAASKNHKAHKHSQTCTFVLHSLLRHIKLLQYSHGIVINLFCAFRILDLNPERGLSNFYSTRKVSLIFSIKSVRSLSPQRQDKDKKMFNCTVKMAIYNMNVMMSVGKSFSRRERSQTVVIRGHVGFIILSVLHPQRAPSGK